jgi:hypothetical protein
VLSVDQLYTVYLFICRVRIMGCLRLFHSESVPNLKYFISTYILTYNGMPRRYSCMFIML